MTKKLSQAEMKKLRTLLDQASASLELDEVARRQDVVALMPELFELRKKGYSFAQITHLVNEVGVDVVEKTLCDYYNEFLASKTDQYMSTMTEQLLLLKARTMVWH